MDIQAATTIAMTTNGSVQPLHAGRALPLGGPSHPSNDGVTWGPSSALATTGGRGHHPVQVCCPATPAQTAALTRRCPRLPPGQAGLLRPAASFGPGSPHLTSRMTSAALSETTYNETDFTIGSCGPSSAITSGAVQDTQPLLAVSVRGHIQAPNLCLEAPAELPGHMRAARQRTARLSFLKWPGAA